MGDNFEFGDGRLVKMEEDCSAIVDKGIPEAESVAQSGKYKEAVESLFVLEKQTRMGGDMKSNTRVQLCMMKVCWSSQSLDLLIETITSLTKKRSLIKSAVSKMVQEACTFVDKLSDKESKIKLIETLRSVTAGKIYVEVERARLTYKLAQMKEAEGKAAEAKSMLLDLQIETFGSMDKKEKVELLLEQMRLCLSEADYVRAQIISRKISTKFFISEDKEIQKLKLKYYELMIKLDGHDGNYLNICKHYQAVYRTPMIENNLSNMQEMLKNSVVYVLLSPFDNEQSDLLNRILADRNLERIPEYKELLKKFTLDQIIQWKEEIVEKFEQALVKGSPGSPPTGVFNMQTEQGQKCWKDLQARVVEHNIRMIAKYYKRIHLKRMSQILDWPADKTEEFLCEQVVNGNIPGAKIDRPLGIVLFQPKKTPVEALDDWSANLNTLMDVLNKVTQVILKEDMIHTIMTESDGTKPLKDSV